MILSQGDLISVVALAVGVQAAFLGILLPLYYGIYASLLGDLLEQAASIENERIKSVRAYLATSDTLINLAAGVWLASIAIEVSLLGQRVVVGGTLGLDSGTFELIGILTALGFPIYSAMVVWAAYSDGNSRELNAFCAPAVNSSLARRASGWLLSLMGVVMPFSLSVAFVLAMRDQPPTSWREPALVQVTLLFTIISLLMVFFWIILGFIYAPFRALRELHRDPCNKSSTAR